MQGGCAATVAAAALCLCACASRSPVLPELLPRAGESVELRDTPFFAQAEYQCGPSALATLLQSTGVDVEPDALVDQVYVPANKGSLQVEMLAATRRAGRIPYEIDPQPRALLTEVAAGRPVLVLQNLGLGVFPIWHYAVVIGFDAVTDSVILRSGTEPRLVNPAGYFLRTWQLAGNWGMVVLRPGEMPAAVDRGRYLRAVALAEAALSPDARTAAYGAALDRWPDDSTAQFGAAFALHAAGDLSGAERAYLKLIANHPRHAAGHNNLAGLLVERGCYSQARELAEQAVAIARRESPGLTEAISDTLRKIPGLPDRRGCRKTRPGPAR